MECKAHLVKQFHTNKRLRSADVPVRIRDSVVHVERKRPDMETIVAVAADNRTTRTRHDSELYIPLFKFT